MKIELFHMLTAETRTQLSANNIHAGIAVCQIKAG